MSDVTEHDCCGECADFTTTRFPVSEQNCGICVRCGTSAAKANQVNADDPACPFFERVGE